MVGGTLFWCSGAGEGLWLGSCSCSWSCPCSSSSVPVRDRADLHNLPVSSLICFSTFCKTWLFFSFLSDDCFSIMGRYVGSMVLAMVLNCNNENDVSCGERWLATTHTALISELKYYGLGVHDCCTCVVEQLWKNLSLCVWSTSTFLRSVYLSCDVTVSGCSA